MIEHEFVRHQKAPQACAVPGWKKRSNARWHGKNTTSNNDLPDATLARLIEYSRIRIRHRAPDSETDAGQPHVISALPCAAAAPFPYYLSLLWTNFAIENFPRHRSAALAGFTIIVGRGNKNNTTGHAAVNITRIILQPVNMCGYRH